MKFALKTYASSIHEKVTFIAAWDVQKGRTLFDTFKNMFTMLWKCAKLKKHLKNSSYRSKYVLTPTFRALIIAWCSQNSFTHRTGRLLCSTGGNGCFHSILSVIWVQNWRSKSTKITIETRMASENVISCIKSFAFGLNSRLKLNESIRHPQKRTHISKIEP